MFFFFPRKVSFFFSFYLKKNIHDLFLFIDLKPLSPIPLTYLS